MMMQVFALKLRQANYLRNESVTMLIMKSFKGFPEEP